MEIERKFLLRAAPGGDLLREGIDIEQAYLFVEPGELRIRRKGNAHFITIKSDGNLIREEWEVEFPKWAFDQLWALAPHRIEKKRHVIQQGNLVLELDIYLG